MFGYCGRGIWCFVSPESARISSSTHSRRKLVETAQTMTQESSEGRSAERRLLRGFLMPDFTLSSSPGSHGHCRVVRYVQHTQTRASLEKPLNLNQSTCQNYYSCPTLQQEDSPAIMQDERGEGRFPATCSQMASENQARSATHLQTWLGDQCTCCRFEDSSISARSF